MKRDQVLDTVKNIICKERNNQHGEPENTFPMIADAWTTYLRDFGLFAPDQELQDYQVADMLATFKECRFRVNPDHADNRLDQIGYLAISVELRARAASVAEGERLYNECTAAPPPQIANLTHWKTGEAHGEGYEIDLNARCAHGRNKHWEACEIHQTFIEKFSKGFDYVRASDKLYYNGKLVARGKIDPVLSVSEKLEHNGRSQLYPISRQDEALFNDWIYDKNLRQVYRMLKGNNLVKFDYIEIDHNDKVFPGGYAIDKKHMHLYLNGVLIAK